MKIKLKSAGPNWAWLAAIPLAFFTGACREKNDPGGFEPPREVEGSAARIAWGVGSKERFDLRPMGPAGGGVGNAAHDEAAVQLAYDLPAGWIALPTNMMRAANFRVAGNERAECYLSILGGDAGGLRANVNRWRAQISLDPMSDGEIDALPRAPFLGGQATLVDVSGTWRGMAGNESNADWRLIGLLLVDPQGSAFLKMTGPDAVILGEKERFLSLARSLHEESGNVSQDGHTHEATESGTATGSGDAIPDTLAMGEHEGLSWTAPSVWKKGPDKAMRAVTFLPSEGVECYLAVLGGDGGGALANVNRWRKQLGREDLSQREFDSLPPLQMLGAESRMIEIEGKGEAAGKSMLGVMAFSKGRSVFVKMTGPTEAVKMERHNFRAFAQSVKEAP